MRGLLAVCLVLVACGPAERAASGAESLAARYAGTWAGRSFLAAGDTGVMWTMVTQVDTAGNLVGSLTFPGGPAAVPVRTVELTDSMAVQELGPYHSPTADAEVVTRTQMRVAGDSVWGTFQMRPTAGGDAVRGRFAGKRAMP